MSAWLSRKVSSLALNEIVGNDEQKQAMKDLQNDFEVSTDKLRTIVNQFIAEMKKGLEHNGATVAMIPSFVTGRPTGMETGTYLAIDLGGTNLRVCQVRLNGSGEVSIQQQKYRVPEPLKVGEMRALCDFISDCIDSFLTEMGTDPMEQTLQLGFTFSFPVNLTAINRGNLMQWTKGFACAGAIGKDPALMLQDSLRRKNLKVRVAAIVNDTVGTLMAHAYRDHDTFMGIIFGTGTNAAYYERMDKIIKWEGRETKGQEMVINMEWGAFDDERRVLPVTIHDNKLDRESINPRYHIYEKLISGMYLGEIVRNVALNLVDRFLLFDGFSSAEFNKQWSFETAYMSTIEVDASPDLDETKRVLESILGITKTTLADRQIIKTICHLVGVRAARLSAAGVAAVVSHCDLLKKDCCTAAVDGSVFEFYPNFSENMTKALRELFGEDVDQKIKFAPSRDGSGLGAAVIAMQVSKGM
ncbi:hypothetical protein VKS41_001350 [Umbelopsis sp. WA50703]